MNDRHCYDFPRPAVTVDVAVFSRARGSWRILLIRRGSDPFAGCFALPGGYVEPMEPLERAAIRELEEETTLRIDRCEQLRAYGDPDRDPRGHTISVTHCAIIDRDVEVEGRDDAGEARWFSIDDLPPLAFDHDQITADAIAWLRARDETK